MKKAYLFNFEVDKKNNAIHIKREFNATRELVWSAWTTPEILDLWWAPKPFQTKTKSMDFREGGFWLYVMLGPENFEHWCRTDYTKIKHHEHFEGYDAFCNSEGEINHDFPRSYISVRFSDHENHTIVDITTQYKHLSDLEKVVEMGVEQGFSASMQNLEQYLEASMSLKNSIIPTSLPRTSTYLNFPGNAEEAFLFYRTVFNSSFSGDGIQRFGDLPADPSQPPIDDAVKKMILHVELPITGNHVLMGTDAPKEFGFTVIQGNNMHINIEPDSRNEAQRIFDALAEDGKITMPLQDMFWGAFYGSLTDKFGINWMINFKK